MSEMMSALLPIADSRAQAEKTQEPVVTACLNWKDRTRRGGLHKVEDVMKSFLFGLVLIAFVTAVTPDVCFGS